MKTTNPPTSASRDQPNPTVIERMTNAVIASSQITRV